jgi:hypothetical protein
MTNRGVLSAPAARLRCALRARRAAAFCAAAADRIFWLLIVITGIVGLSPLSGLAAAREAVAARRERLARISAAPSTVWARQARRNANAALAERGFAARRPPRIAR